MTKHEVRLKKVYQEKAVPVMQKEFGIDNKQALPKITKVTVNMGIGDSIKNKELSEARRKDLASITGQYPSIRNAKLSVASFSIRRGMPVGLTVTLRGSRMYAFLDRLFSLVLPRLRDFRGVSRKSFDNQGNYTLGMAEHTVFPEIDIAKSSPKGLEVTIVVSGKDKGRSQRMLELLGMPFEKENLENKKSSAKMKNK